MKIKEIQDIINFIKKTDLDDVSIETENYKIRVKKNDTSITQIKGKKEKDNKDKTESDFEQEMVTQHYGLVVHQALNFVINKQDLDDYIQSGLIGLLKAIRNYNPDRSKFSTFATVCIRNEILKYAKKQKRQKRKRRVSMKRGISSRRNA